MENEKSLSGSAEEMQEIAKKKIKEQLEAKAELMYNQQKEQEQANFNYNQAALSGHYSRYEPSPREYLHSFLLQAKSAGCSVDSYIDTEIRKMLIELER